MPASRPHVPRTATRPGAAAALLACAVAGAPSSATPLRAQERPATAVLRDGTLSFVAHATVGDFTGTTTQVTGSATAGPGVARGWVEAPVATLRTGNGLRDRDMRSALEADRHPTIRFDATGVTARAPFGPDGTPAVVHGTLTVRGVARAVDVPVTVTRVADTVRVVGGFPLDVAAHGVRGLRRMFGTLRVREVVDVRLALRFVIAGAPALPPADPRP